MLNQPRIDCKKKFKNVFGEILLKISNDLAKVLLYDFVHTV